MYFIEYVSPFRLLSHIWMKELFSANFGNSLNATDMDWSQTSVLFEAKVPDGGDSIAAEWYTGYMALLFHDDIWQRRR